MLCGTPSCFEACLFFSDDLLRLRLQFVQYELQRDFAWVTNEDDCSEDLALLPDLVADCRDSSDCFFFTCLNQFC